MTKTIELIFDFVSPNAYLVWQPLRALAARQGAQIKITPAFLGGMHKLTGNAPPFIRDADVKGKNAYAEACRHMALYGVLDAYVARLSAPAADELATGGHGADAERG